MADFAKRNDAKHRRRDENEVRGSEAETGRAARVRRTIAAITAAELLHGVARAQTRGRKKERSSFVESILSAIEVIDFDLAVARRHAELWASLESVGKILGPYDLLIAATALHYDHAVVTLNVTEFRHGAGVRIIDTGPFLSA